MAGAAALSEDEELPLDESSSAEELEAVVADAPNGVASVRGICVPAVQVCGALSKTLTPRFGSPLQQMRSWALKPSVPDCLIMDPSQQ